MPRTLMMSIAAVERDTGLSKDTLRVWEKRYGFPEPARDAQGERCYPIAQVERLRLIRRLLDVGHRPGRVVALPQEDLQALADHSAEAQAQVPAASATPTSAAWHPSDSGDWVPSALRCVDAQDVMGLKRLLSRALHGLGLVGFIAELVAPLLQHMGEGWLRGRFQVQQEHWVSHCLQQSLHSAIHALPSPHPGHGPRVLLSTFPGEPHAMGLLMVEAWLGLLQVPVVNLGPQTPLWDLIEASATHQADVVALSFSAAAAPTLLQDTLKDFRSKLPEHTAVWVGGRHPLLTRRALPDVLVLDDMASLDEAVRSWRAAHTPLVR